MRISSILVLASWVFHIAHFYLFAIYKDGFGDVRGGINQRVAKEGNTIIKAVLGLDGVLFGDGHILIVAFYFVVVRGFVVVDIDIRLKEMRGKTAVNLFLKNNIINDVPVFLFSNF